MDSLFQSIEDWLKEVLISGIMDNLSGAFDSVNRQVGQITANEYITGKLLAECVRTHQDYLRECDTPGGRNYIDIYSLL